MKNKIWNKLNDLMFNKQKTSQLILIILLLFLLIRVPVLFTGIHQTLEPEELVRGSIAREIIDEPKLNLIDYQGDSYSGGSLISSIITIPFFILLGENLFALKLAPLLIFTLMLFLLFKFCDRFFNRETTLISCFLFIFCPPLWTIYSFLNFGFFHESVLLTLMALFIFYEIFFENKKQNKYFLSLGIICGFSFYFVYLTIFATIAMIITWFLFDKKFFLKKSFLVFIAGGLIGLSPWIYYQLLNNWAGISILFMGKGFRSGHEIGIEMLLGIIKKFFETILLKFPESLYFKDMILNYFYYYILFFFSVVLLYFQNIKSLIKNQLKKPSKETFILIYFVVFLVLFSLSNLVIGNPFIWWRYITPLYPFAFITVALAINRINFNQYKKMFFFGFVFFVLIFWLIGNTQFYETQETNALNEKGFSYTILGKYWDLKMRLGENPKKMIEAADTIDSKYQLFVFYNMKQGLIIKTAKLNTEKSDEKNVNKTIELIELIPEEFKAFYFEELGNILALRSQKEYNSTQKAIELIDLVPEKYKKDAFKGIGMQSVNENNLIQNYDNIPAEYKTDFIQGIGINSIKELLFINTDVNRERFGLIENQVSEFKKSFFIGVGKGLSITTVNNLWYMHKEKKLENISRFFNERSEEEKQAIIQGINETKYLIENKNDLNELNKLINSAEKTFQ